MESGRTVVVDVGIQLFPGDGVCHSTWARILTVSWCGMAGASIVEHAPASHLAPRLSDSGTRYVRTCWHNVLEYLLFHCDWQSLPIVLL